MWCRSYSKYNPVSLKSNLNNFDMSHIHKIEIDWKRIRKKKKKDWKIFKNRRYKCTSLMQKAREQHYEALLIDNEKNSEKFWKIIKEVFPSKSRMLNSSLSVPIIKDTTTDITENNNVTFFASIIHLFQIFWRLKLGPLKILLGVVH